MELIKTNPKSHVLLLPIFQVRRDNYLKKNFFSPFYGGILFCISKYYFWFFSIKFCLSDSQ